MEDDDRLPPSAPSTDLAARLRAAREAAGYSLATMAALTHFSKPYLGHVETATASPPQLGDGGSSEMVDGVSHVGF